MPTFATAAKHITFSAVGVIIAGWVMNATRGFPVMRAAIQGFDA